MADGSILITAELDSSAFKKALGDMRNALDNFLDSSDSRLSASSAEILAVLGGALSALIGTSQRWYDAGEAIVGSLNRGMGSSAADTEYIGAELLSRLLRGMTQGMTIVPGKVSDLINYIKDSFAGSYEGFSDIGLNMTGGVLAGIEKGASFIYDKMSDMCDSVINRVKEKLGIHSPSKVFEQIGENIMLGLENGISEGSASAEDELYRTIRNLGDYSAPGNILDGSVNPITVGASYPWALYSPGMPLAGTVNNSPVMNFYSPVSTPSQLSRAVRKTMKGLIYG